jgi:hypothetical protein
MKKNKTGNTISDVTAFLDAVHPSHKKDLQVVVTDAPPPVESEPAAALKTVTYMVHPKIGKMLMKEGGAAEDADVEWPSTTAIWCHHCAHPFDTMPIPVPISRNSKNRYIVKGIFCGVPCGLRYIEVHGGHDAEEQKLLFRQMAKDVFKLHDAFKAHAAGDALLLTVFGGMHSIEAFRNLSNSPGVTLKTLTAPFVQAQMVTEQRGVPRSLALMGSEIRNIQRPSVLPDPPAPDISGTGLFDEFVKAHARHPEAAAADDGKSAADPKTAVTKKPRAKKAAVASSTQVANDEDTLMQFIAT